MTPEDRYREASRSATRRAVIGDVVCAYCTDRRTVVARVHDTDRGPLWTASYRVVDAGTAVEVDDALLLRWPADPGLVPHHLHVVCRRHGEAARSTPQLLVVDLAIRRLRGALTGPLGVPPDEIIELVARRVRPAHLPADLEAVADDAATLIRKVLVASDPIDADPDDVLDVLHKRLAGVVTPATSASMISVTTATVLDAVDTRHASASRRRTILAE